MEITRYYLQIDIGPYQESYFPNTPEAKELFDSVSSKVLPFGQYEKALIGARSIKIFKPEAFGSEYYCVVYNNFLPTSASPEYTKSKPSKRGYIRSCVLLVDEASVKRAFKSPDWVKELFQTHIEKIGQTQFFSWVIKDIANFDVDRNIETELPTKLKTYAKLGGVGLAYTFTSPQDWTYIEALLRQYVNMFQSDTISLSTLSTDKTEITNIFGLARFKAKVDFLEAEDDEINLELSAKAEKNLKQLNRQRLQRFSNIFSIVVFMLIVTAIIVGGTALIPVLMPTATPTATSTPTPTVTYTASPTLTPTSTPFSVCSTSIALTGTPDKFVTATFAVFTGQTPTITSQETDQFTGTPVVLVTPSCYTVTPNATETP